MPPGHPPKQLKIEPSRSQEATFSLLNFDVVLGSILVPFWLPRCLPLGTLLATKIDQKNDRNASPFPLSSLSTAAVAADSPRFPIRPAEIALGWVCKTL